jgi:hypothetical protein
MESKNVFKFCSLPSISMRTPWDELMTQPVRESDVASLKTNGLNPTP